MAMALAARGTAVTGEPAPGGGGDGGDVKVKEEADWNIDANWLKFESDDVTQEFMSVKQEQWEAGAGLCVKQEEWDTGARRSVERLQQEVVRGTESGWQTDLPLLCGTSPRCARARSPAAAVKQETGLTTNTEPRRNHLEINTYMCDICGELFVAKNTLISHIKVHLTNNTNKRAHATKKAYPCKLCGKSFTQAGHRGRHERRAHAHAHAHAHAPPHAVCDVCQKGFSRLESLRLHQLIHTGLKPYSCEICDKKFTQIGNLSRHVRIHTGERPHACAVCARRFTQSCDLKKHRRVHAGGDKPYACEACARRFICSGDLRKHKRSARHKRTLGILNNTCAGKLPLPAPD